MTDLDHKPIIDFSDKNMTQITERIGILPERSLVTRPYAESITAVEIIPVNGNGKDYHFTSLSGESMKLVRTGDQVVPKVEWRYTEEAPHGEFFMKIDLHGTDLLHTDSRVTIELPIKNVDSTSLKEGPIVSVEKGSVRLIRGSHDEVYVEPQGEVEKIDARGRSIGTEVYLSLPEGSFVKDLYIRGHTYVQTHDIKLVHRIFPVTDVIGMLHVGNGKALEFNNDRINGYEVGLKYDHVQEKYVPQDYSLEELRKMEHSGLQRERSGHEHRLRPLRKKKEVPVSSMPIADPQREELLTTPEMVQESENEVAIRQLKAYIYRMKKFKPRFIPILTKKEQRREAEHQAVLEAEKTVTKPIALPKGDYVWTATQENFQKLGIQPTKIDSKLAVVLTYIATGTDKTPEDGMTHMLNPRALEVLVARSEYPQLQEMVDTLLKSPYVHISEMASRETVLGKKILKAIEEIINPKTQEEKLVDLRTKAENDPIVQHARVIGAQLTKEADRRKRKDWF